MHKTHEKATNDKAKEAPIKLQLVSDDSLAYCDPETGVCTVPGPATKTGKETSPTSNKQALKTRQSH